MATPFTLKNLRDVEDSAQKFGIGEIQEARFAKDELSAEQTGFSHHRVKPSKRQAFGHRHERCEEVYVVLAGAGQAKLDEEIVELEPLDAIRVAPGVTRAFQAGPEGLEVLVFGPRADGDGELVQGWWRD
jgi:mannose-6-phosphate isomerase-like protein (cupin superfamily)